MTIAMKFTNADTSQNMTNAIKYIFFKTMDVMEDERAFDNSQLLS